MLAEVNVDRAGAVTASVSNSRTDVDDSFSSVRLKLQRRQSVGLVRSSRPFRPVVDVAKKLVDHVTLVARDTFT